MLACWRVHALVCAELRCELGVEFSCVGVVEGVCPCRISGERLQNVPDGGADRSLHDLLAVGKYDSADAGKEGACQSCRLYSREGGKEGVVVELQNLEVCRPTGPPASLLLDGCWGDTVGLGNARSVESSSEKALPAGWTNCKESPICVGKAVKKREARRWSGKCGSRLHESVRGLCSPGVCWVYMQALAVAVVSARRRAKLRWGLPCRAASVDER